MRSPRSRDLAERAAFLFDLDGTLVDSSGAHAAAYRAALAEGAPALLDGFDYDRIRGLDTRASLRALGVAEADLARLAARKQAAYREAVARGTVRAFPGAAELLAMLVSRGRRLALVTSASRASALPAVASAGLDRFFATVVTGDEVERGKPDPALYRRALAVVGVDAEEAVAIEDAESGVAAARAAGVEVVMVHAIHPEVPSFADLGALHRALAGGAS
jgi:HAD superfamily hydrolase (TIGR01509 family)